MKPKVKLMENIDLMINNVLECPMCHKSKDHFRNVNVCTECADTIEPKPVKVEAPEKMQPTPPLEVKPKQSEKKAKNK